MNEKELRKLLTEKQKEMEAAQREYYRIHYARQIRSFTNALSNCPELTDLILTENLSSDDCKLLGELIGKKIRPIYRNFTDYIAKNQERRKSKNRARNERRHSSEITENQPLTSTVNMAGTSSATMEGTAEESINA